MDPLIQYCHQKTDLIRGIVTSRDNDLIESFYRLMMHYGWSVREFFSIGLTEMIQASSIETTIGTILRENDIMTNLIKEYFFKHGGKYGQLVRRIREVAVTYQNGTSDRHFKKAIQASIDLLEQKLVSSMSNDLVDFCNTICVRINSLHDRAGETIAASFVFFSILTPFILGGDSTQISVKSRPQLLRLTKALTQIAAGTADGLGKLQKYAAEWTDRFRKIIGLALARRRDADYCKRTPLSSSEVEHWHQVFLDKLDIYRKAHSTNSDIRRLKYTLSQQEIKTRPVRERITVEGRANTLDNLQIWTDPHLPASNRSKELVGSDRLIRIAGKIDPSSDPNSPGSILHVHSDDKMDLGIEPPVRIGSIPISFTLEHLMGKARSSCSYPSDRVSLPDDLRYVILWKPSQVQAWLSKEKVDLSFFRLWNINGRDLLEFDRGSLERMGYSEDIEDLLEVIDKMRKFALLDPTELSSEHLSTWTQREVSLWLMLSGMDDLIKTFTRLKIDGARMIDLSLKNFREMQINRPRQILKLTQLQNDYAEYENNPSLIRSVSLDVYNRDSSDYSMPLIELSHDAEIEQSSDDSMSSEDY